MMKTLIYLFILTTLITACKYAQEDTITSNNTINTDIVKLTKEQFKNAGIKTGGMEQKSLATIIKANGTIDVPPQNLVSISSQLGGYLKKTHLLPGMHVKKGETIAIMEDLKYIQLQEDYLREKTRLKFLTSEFERQKELNQSKANSDKVYQQAETDYTTQKILVKALIEKIKLLSVNPEKINENNISGKIAIKSPIDGFVSKVMVNVGKYINPTDVLFEIVNPTDIHLAITIYEKNINQIYIGQKLKAFTNNNPEKKYNCEIILIDKDLSTDRSIQAHCHFKNYDKTLIPGLFMNADIEALTQTGNALPTEAIVSYEGKSYIFAEIGEYTYKMIEVKTGNTENKYTEITNGNEIGLKNLKTITKGGYNLLMKLKNTNE